MCLADLGILHQGGILSEHLRSEVQPLGRFGPQRSARVYKLPICVCIYIYIHIHIYIYIQYHTI